LSDVYSDSPLDGFEPGAVVAAVVVATGAGGRVDLSLRASRGGSGPKADAAAEKHQAELSAAADVSPGALVWGFVRHVSPKGCFVSLGRGLDARVLLSNLSDTFVPAPAAAFPAGALVRGRVLAVDAASGRVELSLKASEASGAPLLALADLTAGQTVRGTVKRCEAYGAFIAVDGSALVGMCHISEAADARVKDLAKLLRPGQRVRARVLTADTDTGRLSLGLKPSYFDGQADDEEATGAPAQGVDALAAYPDDDSDDSDSDEDGAGASSDDEMEEADEDAADVMDADEEDDDDESESEEAPSVVPPPKKGRAKAPSGDEVAQRMRDAPAAWAAPGGDDDELAFQWTDGRAADAGGAADDDDAAAEAGAPSAAAAKKARKRAREAAEAAIRERERALATGDAAPASAADFERALLGSPNSSFLWIRYMAHLVSLGEVAAARAVAERALGDGGVGYREQGEQLNVWVAWLNLENAYGQPTPEAAVSALFARAVQRNDAKKLHLARAGLHERAGQPEQAQKAAAALTRRFPASCKAWLRAHAAHLGAGAADAGRGALDAAVAALPRRKHAKLLVGAALAEFRSGDAERGRALLEGVLAAHPKRLDVWGVYLDAEAKTGDAQRTRALFERAVHLDLPPRKAKSLFKRYLAHEAAHGDKDGVARVKQLAADYVAQRGV
jgi:rRNA biogenesis protein RRP5